MAESSIDKFKKASAAVQKKIKALKISKKIIIEAIQWAKSK